MGRGAHVGHEPRTGPAVRPTPPPRSQATLLAAATMTVLAGFFLVEGVRTLLLVRGSGEVGRSTRRVLVQLRVPLEAGTTALVLVGGLVSLLAVVFLVAAVGVVLRRSWGREAGGMLAGVFALVATPLAIGGLTAQPPAADAAEGLLVGLANLGVVALLLSRPVASDFAAIEHWRARRR